MKTRYKILLFLFALTTVNVAFAADLDSEDMKYRRSSIYSILVTHSEQKFSKEITEEFLKIPTPDKYNDMNLSVRVLSLNSGVKSPYSIYTLSGVSEPAGTVDASEIMVSKFWEAVWWQNGSTAIFIPDSAIWSLSRNVVCIMHPNSTRNWLPVLRVAWPCWKMPARI